MENILKVNPSSVTSLNLIHDFCIYLFICIIFYQQQTQHSCITVKFV